MAHAHAQSLLGGGGGGEGGGDKPVLFHFLYARAVAWTKKKLKLAP